MMCIGKVKQWCVHIAILPAQGAPRKKNSGRTTWTIIGNVCQNQVPFLLCRRSSAKCFPNMASRENPAESWRSTSQAQFPRPSPNLPAPRRSSHPAWRMAGPSGFTDPTRGQGTAVAWASNTSWAETGCKRSINLVVFRLPISIFRWGKTYSIYHILGWWTSIYQLFWCSPAVYFLWLIAIYSKRCGMQFWSPPRAASPSSRSSKDFGRIHWDPMKFYP